MYFKASSLVSSLTMSALEKFPERPPVMGEKLLSSSLSMRIESGKKRRVPMRA